MKNHEEFRRSVFEKAERYEKARKKRNKRIIETVSLCSLCVVIGISAFFAAENGFFLHQDAVDTTTNHLPTDITDSHNPTEVETPNIENPVETTAATAATSSTTAPQLTSSTSAQPDASENTEPPVDTKTEIPSTVETTTTIGTTVTSTTVSPVPPIGEQLQGDLTAPMRIFLCETTGGQQEGVLLLFSSELQALLSERYDARLAKEEAELLLELYDENFFETHVLVIAYVNHSRENYTFTLSGATLFSDIDNENSDGSTMALHIYEIARESLTDTLCISYQEE